MSYWACIVARNAASHLSSTLDSLLNQTLKPKLLVTVDDGSRDATSEILSVHLRKHSDVMRVLTLPDNGYDIRRVPRNINLAWRFTAASGLKTDYFMISGDDCRYPSDYVRLLMSRMASEPKLVIASGRPSSGGGMSHEHSPSGSGRLIKCSLWRELGEKYPIKAGWETWLLYKAMEKSFEVKLFDDLIFEHVRPRGTKHQFTYWGAAMQALGYYPFYAMGRIVKNLIERRVGIGGCLSMLRGYLLTRMGSSDPFMSPFEESLRRFVRTDQVRKIAKLLTAAIGGRNRAHSFG